MYTGAIKQKEIKKAFGRQPLKKVKKKIFSRYHLVPDQTKLNK
jgi:hypothetical protein